MRQVGAGAENQGETMKKRAILLAMLVFSCLLPACMADWRPHDNEAIQAAQEHKRRGRLQDQGDGSCLDLVTGKLWQLSRSNKTNSLPAANQYIHELRLANHDDWRLPSLAELYELFLVFDQPGSGDCAMDFEGSYWSGDKDNKGRVGAWELDGECHPEREYVPNKAGYVRAVRP